MLYKFTREDLKANFAFVKDEMIQNHFNWTNWQRVSSKHLLMKIKSLDLAEKTATATAVTAMMTATAMLTAMARAPAMGPWKPGPTLGMDDRKEFWDLWNKNQSIPGNIFLHSPSGKLVWISCVDLKYFEEVE